MTTPTKQELRAAAIFEQAIWGLLEYYPCFNDQTLCLECESVVKVPDTGNDQLDYENVRDQVEKFAKAYEAKHGGVRACEVGVKNKTPYCDCSDQTSTWESE